MNCPKCSKELIIKHIGTVDEEQECSCGYYKSAATGDKRPTRGFEYESLQNPIVTILIFALLITMIAISFIILKSVRPRVTTVVTDTSGNCWEMTMASGDDLSGRYSPIDSMIKVPCKDKK